MRFFHIAAAAVLVCAPFGSLACEICGCIAGNSTLGLLPLWQRHFVGLRWQEEAYRTTPHGRESSSQERFQTFDVWGRWMPHRRWQFIAVVPFRHAVRTFDDGRRHLAQGWGDLSLSAHYTLVGPLMSRPTRRRHTLQVGIGIGLPTGRSDIRNPELPALLLPPALQPGSGSTSTWLSALYALTGSRWGVSAEGQVRWNGSNNTGFRPGAPINGGLRLFYVWSAKRPPARTVIPFVGVQMDYRLPDEQDGERLPETGGWTAYGALGTELFALNTSIGVAWRFPVAHELSGGFVSPVGQLTVYAAYLIRTSKPPGGNLPPPFSFQEVPTHSKSDKK